MKRLILFPLTVASALATGGFYEETVPPLPVFLGYDRLPKKSLVDITREVRPLPETPEPDFSKEILAFAAELKSGKAPHDLLGKVDALITAERARLKREGSGLNSLLHDLRDLCTGPAEASAASAYLQWRLENSDAFGFRIKNSSEVLRDPYDEAKPDDQFVKDLGKRLAAAPPALKPHYLYAHAAYLFRLGDDQASEDLFREVAEKFPAHPRAEAALYMEGRCLSRQSRELADDHYKNVPAKVAAARKTMRAYLLKYPQGRFAGDVQGWLGGLEMNAERYADALPYFFKQLDVPGHPEFAVSATKEIEVCFRHLHDHPLVLAKALNDPRVAAAAVYFACNEIEPVDNNGEYESTEYVAKWRHQLLPALAAALAKKADLFKGEGWPPRYNAMLALAASGQGNHEAAMKWLGGVDPSTSDDVTFAQGVVLQRAKKLPAAIDAYRALAQNFPKSPLLPGARVREALTLIDDHRSGEAALLLMGLDEKKKKPAKAAPTLPVEKPEQDQEEPEYEEFQNSRDLLGVEPADPGQIRQLLDTVFNFAPLAELSSVVADNKAPEEYRSRLRSVIAVRHLARERFAEAKPFMPPAQWEQIAAPLAELTAAAQAATTPAEKEATAMKLAGAWAAARGKLLTVPLDTEEWRTAVYKSAHPDANFRRLQNAPALGLTGANAVDLDNRDELRHAYNWWIAASDAQPKTPGAATAVWHALRAMPEIAQVSPYSLDRAAAKKWGEISHKLYERLEKENPDAPETKRLAVWWTFPAGKGEDGHPILREELNQALEKASPGEEETPEDEVKARVTKVLPTGPVDLEKLKQDVGNGRRWAKAKIHALPSQCVVNFFEDLDLFLTTPGLAPEVAKRYVELRYDTLVSSAIGYSIFESRPGPEKKDDPGTSRADEALLADIRAAIADPKFAKVTDFLAFLEIAVTANHWVTIPLKTPADHRDKNGDQPTYWGRDYAEMERLCRAWLEKYPASRKREAALLLHCRALSHAMEPYVYYRRLSWPVAPRWEGAEIPEEIERLKFDAKAWQNALDLYDKEFPKGVYTADVIGYRADLAIRLKDWKGALQITLAQMQGKDHLHPGAENRMREILSHLANDDDRADLLAAIRATGGARAALDAELKEIENMDGHPLLPLREWLEEQAQQ